MALPAMAMGSLISGAFDLVDDLFTSDEEREAAKLKLIKAQQAGKLKELEVSMSAILAEANSEDPWTSRARPSFLYVMYAMILAAIPMGILSAFSPATATAVASGMQAWLGAIPEGMWATFGAGFLGYSAARSVDKMKGSK